MLRLILLGFFCISLNHASEGFLRLVEGSIFLKSDSRKNWSQVAADMSLRLGDTWKTSSNFAGTVYIGDQSKSLQSNSTYQLQKDGLYTLQGESWYPVSVVVQSKNDTTKLKSTARLRGEITPENYLFIFRQGSTEPSKFFDVQKVYFGDVVQLPADNRAQMIMLDGSRLQFGAGSIFEIGHEGIFVRSGSVFSNIRRQLSRFEITTEDALISVRGTIFNVSCSDETIVEVYEGVVKVSNRGALKNTSIFLEKGKGVRVRRDLNQLSNYDFDSSRHPSYSRKLVPKKSFLENDTDEEKLAMQAIQERLTQARDRGFKEYTSVQTQFENGVENANPEQARVGRKSLQEYLARVAGPGEDADYRIFKGEQKSIGTSKIVESWKDEYRKEVQSSTELQRQKVDSIAEDYKDLQDIANYRKENVSIDLKTKLQQEDFDRRKADGGVKQITDRATINREITSIKKFITTQNLELKRVESEKVKLVREKDLIQRKMDSIENSLGRSQDQEDLLRTLSALRLQKRQVEANQKILNARGSDISSSLNQANQTLRKVILGSFGRIRQDTEFLRESRRRLRGY